MESFSITANYPRYGDPYMGLLRAFKERYCDENVLISEALRTRIPRYIYGPVLDVGAGLGDIATLSFPDTNATLLDTEPWEAGENPLHKRVKSDFFGYAKSGPRAVGTILLSHVLQYLDDDVDQLRRVMTKLDAKSVITVLNDNDDAFGELMTWAEREIAGANIERPIVPVSLSTYEVCARVKFVATIICPDFDVMANHFLTGLVDAENTPATLARMRNELQSRLSQPAISINETITCYEKR